ncbi:MAG TPA: tripartite tricarboxylate transporter substrate binding protein [Burkholderiales bacterium]|nr:tripartite tricarboxylate transporter substrate binding protein [Burkholderiales bacterium]
MNHSSFIAPRSSLVLLCAALLAAALPATAQQYPSRPVRFVVPFAPGGSTDTLARTMGVKLADALGQQVVVDNRPGGNGDIGMLIVARAPADGHTIVLGYIANLAIAPSLQAKMPYDPVKDFAPITQPASSPNVLTAHPSVQARNLKELIALAKASPGKVSFASTGVASIGHLTGELINNLAAIRMTHVPYKGSGQAVTDILGGHVQVMFSGFSSTLHHIKAGKLRALAVTGPKRAPALSDVPTIAEQGFPGVEATAWYGVLAPAGTPRPVVMRLHGDLVRSLRQPDVVQKLDGLGFEIVGSTPEQFGAYIRSETRKWEKVVRASGAKSD